LGEEYAYHERQTVWRGVVHVAAKMLGSVTHWSVLSRHKVAGKRITAAESWCEVAGSRAREDLAANESKWVGGCEDGVRKSDKV
jgi:hypothetical protein